MKLALEDIAGRPVFMLVIKLASRILLFFFKKKDNFKLIKNAAEPQGNVLVIQLSKLLIGITVLFSKKKVCGPAR